jgi:methylmalonyl-CoA mutase
MNDREKLFSEFPLVSVAEWESKIREDLEGDDYAKKLIRKTHDNINIKPYYTSEDLADLKYLDQQPGSFPFVRSAKKENNKWEIRQDFKVSDIEAVLEKMLLAQTRGTTSLGIDLTTKGDLNYHDFRKLIEDIDLTQTELNFIVSDNALQVLDFLLKALDELGMDRRLFRGSIGFDPLGYLAATGGFISSQQNDLSEATKLILTVKTELPGLRALSINSNLFGNSGASAVQELAFGLSMISDYLMMLTEQGTSVSDVARSLQWNLSVGSDYFIEMAKVRAARMLFSALISAFDQSEHTPVYIHCITTNWNKTLYDPNVNLLRLTTEAMSAILGGCDSLLVQPFDSSYNEPTDFSERLARNVQIILKEESYFDKVVDPASGSYYIESLTDSLLKNAWDQFLKIDEKGGFIKAFTEGYIIGEIAKTAKSRSDMVAQRRDVLLGTNQYPNMNESVNGCIAEDIAFSQPAINSYKITEPIPHIRAAAEFEKLRLSVERHNGTRPKVFLLTYGNLAMRLARSQFSANFFACAGYEVLDNMGFKTVSEGADAALKAKAEVVVLCSSDDEYAQIAPQAAELIKDRAILVVAGAPANMDELKGIGISEFIHIRSNVLETLKSFHKKLGIEIK